jgi:hypothetical protein
MDQCETRIVRCISIVAKLVGICLAFLYEGGGRLAGPVIPGGGFNNFPDFSKSGITQLEAIRRHSVPFAAIGVATVRTLEGQTCLVWQQVPQNEK